MNKLLNYKGKLKNIFSISVLIFTANTAIAGEECYSFSQQEPNKEYPVGGKIKAKHSKLVFKKFFFDKDKPAQADIQNARVHNGRIAQGETPELRLSMINALIKPKKPVKKVRFKFAENANALVANISVNGKLKIVNGGLKKLNGKVIGMAPKGKAKIAVNVTPSPVENGGFNVGTIELVAISGRIESASIGGQILHVDDYCIEQ